MSFELKGKTFAVFNENGFCDMIIFELVAFNDRWIQWNVKMEKCKLNAITHSSLTLCWFLASRIKLKNDFFVDFSASFLLKAHLFVSRSISWWNSLWEHANYYSCRANKCIEFWEKNFVDRKENKLAFDVNQQLISKDNKT